MPNPAPHNQKNRPPQATSQLPAAPSPDQVPADPPSADPPAAGPLPARVYADRLARAQAYVASNGVAGLIITPGRDFAYLTGSWSSSHERLTALVITPNHTPRIVAPATDLGELSNSLLGQLDVELTSWRDGDDPHGLVAALIAEAAAPRIAVSADITGDHLLRLQHRIAPADWMLTSEALKGMFTAKDDAEITQLAFAAAAIDAVHAQVPDWLRAGRTEREVAADIEAAILARHHSVDFVIVGSGENGADPHHSYSDRVLCTGDPVVVDIGGTVGAGYHSDCTRTYVVGGDIDAAPDDFRAAYEVLRRAHRAACEAARPGQPAATVDAAARTTIADAGLGEYFVHRTGHGIGLSLHEEPFISADNHDELIAQQAFSIEPGIYMPGKWGMRLEDIVVTTEDGIRLLNNAPRDLR